MTSYNAEKLPDSYAKDKNSNNYKLLELNELSIETLKNDMSAVYDLLDLEQATGATLDLYGEMVGQKRGALNDEQYRILIWQKIGLNNVKGDYNSIVEVLRQVFKCNASDIILNDGKESCKVALTKFPLTVLLHAGFSSTQAVEIIESLLPIGVTIEEANFSGTFEFAEDATTYDESAGFGDIEQTIGGYLGLLLGDESTVTIDL